MRIAIRPCVSGDESLVLGFVARLAAFEGLAASVRATEADIRRALFGAEGVRPCDISAAFALECDGSREIGFALWYPTFSTFRGTRALFLEDLYVDPAFRGKGVATALFDYLRERARESGSDRIEWSVLAWNEGAKDFYRSVGGAPKAGWELYGLELT